MKLDDLDDFWLALLVPLGALIIIFVVSWWPW
jgi:hypothetical protein